MRATIGSSFDELSSSEESDTPFSISVNNSLSSSLLGGSALNEVYSSKSDNNLNYSLEQSLAEETPESQILMDYLNQNVQQGYHHVNIRLEMNKLMGWMKH